MDGIYRLLMSAEVQPVNIGNPNEFTMLEFAYIVNELTGNRAGVIYKALPVDDPKQRKPDISKARRVLGWEPRIEVREGVTHTIEDFRRRMKARGLLAG